MKKFSILLLLAFFAMSSNALAGTIKIGLMCPLTGSWASEGQDMQQILSLLMDSVNKAGGINGDTLELLVEDDAGDPRTAALAAQKLATSGVVAVVGTYGSAVTEAAQNILDEAGLLHVATGSTSVRLTEKGQTLFFRTCPRDDQQGMVAARILKELGFKKIAILHDNSSYAKGLAVETRVELKQAGLDVTFFDALTPKERDYSAILTKIKSQEPDVIFFTGYYPEAGLLLRQKNEMGWNVPMMGGDAVNNPDLVKIAGTAAAKDFLFISPPVPADMQSPEGKAFLASYKERYNSVPQSVWAILAGDAFNVVVESLRKSKAEPEAMAAFLRTNLGQFSGITGVFSFNEKGDRVGDLYQLYTVDANGAFILK